MPQSTRSLALAGLTIRLESPVPFEELADHAVYRDFIAARAGSGPDCRLTLSASSPSPEAGEDYFDPQGNWRLTTVDDRRVLRIGPPAAGGRRRAVAVFGADYADGVVHRKDPSVFLDGFIDQFLVVNLLSRCDGFLLHAAGIIWEGSGILFSGVSGAGKSTLLKLFSPDLDREGILNDDRVALRRLAGAWRVFGTPYHGEVPITSPSSAPAKALFFIVQARHNHVRRLSPLEVLGRLATLSILPLWDKEATSRVLGTFESVIRDIPAYELGFLPDKSAVERIKETVRAL